MIKKQKRKAEGNTDSALALPPQEKPSFVDRLGRNMALAGALVLAVVAARNYQLPDGKTVAAAVQQMVTPQIDEKLGAIDFVGNFFPDTVSVFFSSAPSVTLTAPVTGKAVHAFSSQEPYVSYETQADGKIYAAAAGQVMALAHGPEEEWILRIRHEDGLETVYYSLSEIDVREGDQVTDQTCLGKALTGQEAILEVRRAGLAVDPTAYLQERPGI